MYEVLRLKYVREVLRLTRESVCVRTVFGRRSLRCEEFAGGFAGFAQGKICKRNLPEELLTWKFYESVKTRSVKSVKSLKSVRRKKRSAVCLPLIALPLLLRKRWDGDVGNLVRSLATPCCAEWTNGGER